MHDEETRSVPAPGDLRRELRQRRRAIKPTDRQKANHQLCQRLAQDPLIRRCRRIAAYLPFDGEIDPGALYITWQAEGRQLFLPVTPAKAMGPRMYFIPAGELNDEVNHYGIREPRGSYRDAVKGYSLDAILVPLVAFDREGHRLGMGKGYYDEYLAGIRDRFRRPHFIGVAHACQEAVLTPQPWDVTLDRVVTDQETIIPGQVE